MRVGLGVAVVDRRKVASSFTESFWFLVASASAAAICALIKLHPNTHVRTASERDEPCQRPVP